ncbi:McrC family protein [Burkholderia cenocepacia]
MLWSIPECASSELPDFNLEWLPKGLPAQIRPFWRGRNVGIEVDTLVGSIPLKNGDTLQLMPRVGKANFIRLLVESESDFSWNMKTNDDLVDYSFSEEASLGSLVARPFVRCLLDVQSGSLRFVWRSRREVSDVAGGELDVVATSIALLQRNQRPFVFSRKIRTTDVPENIVLAAAANIVLLRYARQLGKEDRLFLSDFCKRFNFLALDEKTIEGVRTRLATGQYDGARGYYAPALRLALILLGEFGFKQGAHSQIRAEPVLFNSATIFEAYVRQQLRLGYQRRGLSVRKGFFPPMSLFNDGSLILDPYIVISKDERLLLVGDVKYKVDGVSAADYYQAHIYARRAFQKYFVFFSTDEHATQVRSSRRMSFLDVEVFEIKLPLVQLENATEALRNLERVVPDFRPQ